MRIYNATAQALREARKTIIAPYMVWVNCRSRSTGIEEGVGFWQGRDPEVISVVDMFSGVTADYTFYSQTICEVTPPRYAVGIGIDPITISLSSIHNAVKLCVREREARGAEVQVWRRTYDPDTMQAVAIEPVYKGYVNTAPITRQPIDSESDAVVEMEIVSTARMLTIASNLKKSHTVQKNRNGDKFRQYKATAGVWEVPWGPSS